MLQQFLTILIISIIFLIALIIIKIALPILRFMVRAHRVINLYKVFKMISDKEFPAEAEITISYGKAQIKLLISMKQVRNLKKWLMKH